MRRVRQFGEPAGFKFMRIFIMTMFVITFVAIIGYWSVISCLAVKVIGGVQTGEITTEKAGEQVGKFLKGIEQGKK